MSTTPTEELSLTEVLAFHLYQSDAEVAKECTSRGDCVDLWQSRSEARRDYREKSKTLLAALHDSGVKVILKKPALAEQFLKQLAIIPARVAYDFANDVA